MNKMIFTSESVTEGHPDKICDQISDAVLDAILAKDPNAHVACECAITTGMILVMGEISSEVNVDVASIARQTVNDIGYYSPNFGFDGHSCNVLVSIDKQSKDIAQGVNDALETRGTSIKENGAGDQGMMFGYADDETDCYMPMPIYLAHKLTRRLTEVRKKGLLTYLRPDGKSQVSVEYLDGKASRIDSIVVSTQHSAEINIEQLRKDIIKHVIYAAIPNQLIDEQTKILINPTGRFVVGGPVGDSGLTGRKIIVDTYGGMSRHGGGAFSGKDPSKVDRSAAYYTRYIAKNIVAAGLAHKCEIQVAYAIGVAKPVSININTFGTSQYSEEQLITIINQVFDLRPSSIIKELNLCRPIYKQTASYGHFGRDDIDLPWEKTDKVNKIKALVHNI